MGDDADEDGTNNCKNNIAYWACNGNNGGVPSGVLEIIRVKGSGFSPAIRKCPSTEEG